MLNALTIDLEEFFHTHNLKQCWAPSTWSEAPNRSQVLVPRILEALARHNLRCTWFVLGWMAARSPDLVRMIADAGHEIGSHGHSHCLVYELGPEAFRDDVLRATDAIERVVGTRPTVFRAPCFSITKRSLWAFDTLRECGYEIDSSVFPIVRRSYGIPDFPRHPHRLENGLVEFPLTVLDVAGRAVPLAGGGYVRLAPNFIVPRLLKRVMGLGRPVNFYCHPWEFDLEEPYSPGIPLQKRLRHTLGRRSFIRLFERLLSEMSWAPMSEVVNAHVPPE
jgi:polysaccharide deacetylase family protein (PEP-CTERM system associated)